MGRKRIEMVCLALLAGILVGCSNNRGHDEISQTLTIEEASAPLGWNAEWIVYWDMDFEGELGESESNPENLCLFSCFFDDSGNIYYPDEFAELREKNSRYARNALSFCDERFNTSSERTDHTKGCGSSGTFFRR